MEPYITWIQIYLSLSSDYLNFLADSAQNMIYSNSTEAIKTHRNSLD